ncbi:MAG: DUF6351 family protein [Jatrophihabitantaceae bacterium]
MRDLLPFLAVFEHPHVIDHMGYMLEFDGLTDADFARLLDVPAHGSCWIKLSGPYRIAKTKPLSSVEPIARALVATRPDRLIWGSDWPHLPNGHRDTGDLLNLLGTWAPDPAVGERILVDTRQRCSSKTSTTREGESVATRQLGTSSWPAHLDLRASIARSYFARPQSGRAPTSVDHRRRYMISRPLRLCSAAAVVLAGTLASPASATSPSALARIGTGSQFPIIRVLSTRADLVSGATALVAVVVARDVAPSKVRVRLGRKDITREFAADRLAGLMSGVPARNLIGLDRSAHALIGRVHGLALGANVLTARLPSGNRARITITNHPSGGPIFSGPQIHPWSCNSGAEDSRCDRKPTYQFFFMPADANHGPQEPNVMTPDPRFQTYDPSNPPPASTIATTTTDEGRKVPFIVRVETGSVDRGQYTIGVLYNPAKSWSPWRPQAGWDHKLMLLGGANCGVSYAEGSAPSPLWYPALARGFAVAANALDVTGSDCNIVTQAESELMTKQRLIDEYGLVRYTTGIGGSGESIVQQGVANAYPGIYDGIIPESSFPDAWTAQIQTDDCDQIMRYWENPQTWSPGVTWSPLDMRAVEDGDVPSSCAAWAATFGRTLFTPTSSNSGVSSNQQYNPTTNPCGIRTTLWDYSVNVLGRRPKSVWSAPEKACGRGFANRPFDNVGVELGRSALLAGQLTPAQFADLNAHTGGRDIDYNQTKRRTTADYAALTRTYRTGEVNEANNMHLPIIDIRTIANADLHDTYQSFSMRARLNAANGTHANQAIWMVQAYNTGFAVDPGVELHAFNLMNRWLNRIEADSTGRSIARKVIADKPAAVVDRCTTADGIAAPCVVPASGSPRLGAGEPIRNDIWQCQLKPLTRKDFPSTATFTQTEWSELKSAFPTGVCNYTKAAVGHRRTVAWLTYQNSHGAVIYGGRPLGPAPRSVSFAS